MAQALPAFHGETITPSRWGCRIRPLASYLFSVLMLVSTAVRRPPDRGNTVPSRVHTRPFLWLWRNSCFNTSIENATWPIGPGLN